MTDALVAVVTILALALTALTLVVALSMLTRVVFVILDALYHLKHAPESLTTPKGQGEGEGEHESGAERTFGFMHVPSITLPEHAPEGATDE